MSKTLNNLQALQNELHPEFLPKMSKTELFNAAQDAEPINKLVNKNFKVVGVMPQMVSVPKRRIDVEDETDIEEVEMCERMRYTVFTDVGVFHSFSGTFNRALNSAYRYLAEEFTQTTFDLQSKVNNQKMNYVLKIVE